MPIGSGIVYNTGDLILSQVSSSGTAFLETKIASATSSIIYFDSTARINSASLNSITVGTASYVSGSTSIITNLTASNISASATGYFNNLGVGTTVITEKVNVAGNILLSNGSNRFVRIGSSTNYNYDLQTTGNDFQIIEAGTTPRLTIQYPNGNVGIGTTSPTARLHVSGSTGGVFEVDTAGGVTSLYVSGSGNVGIGTTSPNDKLHVSGSITAGTNTSTFGTTILQGYYTAGSLTVLGTEQSSGGPVLGYAVTPSTSSTAAFLSSTTITIPRSAYTQDGGTHRWYIGASQTAAIGSAVSLSEVMRINSSGNIGIGTTVPTGRLNIASTSQTTKAIIQSVSAATGLGGYLAFNPGGDSTYSKVAIGVYDNYFSSFNRGNIAFMINSVADSSEVGFSDTKMYISASGNVGVGTTNPTSKLEIYANTAAASTPASTLTLSNALDGGHRILFKSSTGNLVAIDGDITSTGAGTDDGVFKVSTSVNGSLSERMRINSSGNVGIGTTSPAYLLDVSGSSRHGYRSADNHYFTGSVNISGSLNATASWANNVVSASFATTAQTANALNAANSYTVAGLTSAYVDVNGSSAPTTGIYRPSTKTLGLSADSTLIFKISNVSAPATSSIETGNFLVSGSVGIGTTSPIDKLDLNSGNIRLSDNYKLYNGSSNDSVGIYFSNTLQANIAGYSGIIFRSSATNISSQTERMRITSDGNVGIGTTVPSGSLTVQSNANQLRLQTTSGPGAYFTEISSRYDSTHPFQLGVANNSSTATEFFGIYADSGGSNNRSVFPTGNVGIGTTSPNSKLEVAGGSGTAIISINNTTAGRSGSFGIDSNGVYIQNSNNGDYFDLKNASGTARFRMIYDNATHLTTNFVSIGNLSATGSKLSVFGNLSVGSTYGSTAAPSNGAIFQGSVGIGTTSPDSNLHVYSTSFEPAIRLTSTSGSTKTYGLVNNPGWATGSFHIYDFTTDNSRIHISSTGNIGLAVGSTTPANRLDVVGDLRVRAAGAAMILDTATTSDGRMEYKYNGTRKALIGVDSDNLQIAADSGNYLQFRTNSTQRMIINNSGGVGIGTSNPYYLFDLYDTGANSAMMSLRSSGSGNARIYLDAANGDLTGGDYCYLGQDNSSLDFIINTGGSAGNIHLQPKEGTNNGILYVSGSTRFGRVISQTHEFTGSINLSGSLNATASWANNVVSASFATTAQTANALNTGNSYTIAGLTNNGTLSQQNTLSMGSGYQILATTGTVTNPGISFVGDTNTGFYTPSADNIGIVTNGSEKVRIDSSGNVGVGSSSPSSKFEVLTSAVALANQPNIIGNFRGDTDGRSLIRVDNTSTSAGAAALQAGISFVAYSNVSSQPSANKHEAQIILGSTGATSVPGGQTGTLQIVAPQDIAFNVSASNTIMTGSNYTAFGYNAMYIARSGNVGIGTTSPSFKLDVSGSGANARIGNAEIGQWPAATAYTYFGHEALDHSVGGNYAVVQSSAGETFINSAAGQVMHFSVGNSEKVQISSAGNVGINTQGSVINAKLTISGSGSDALLHIKSPISGAILYVSGSGAVGIGTSNVGAFTLQVSGSFGATTKSFIIDHPTKAGKKLMYGSLESPYHGIRLTGRDTLKEGKCKIELPDYIYKLILHDSVNIQLTGIKCNKTLYVDDINIPENYFTIAYDKALFESYKDYDFFWDFTAIRADVPELNTEL